MSLPLLAHKYLSNNYETLFIKGLRSDLENEIKFLTFTTEVLNKKELKRSLLKVS